MSLKTVFALIVVLSVCDNVLYNDCSMFVLTLTLTLFGVNHFSFCFHYN